MDFLERLGRISNRYYNMGLEKAQSRDLWGASYCLKQSLRFNKNNINSRNLLGLVYSEAGEVAQALRQWVISDNLQPEGNDARRLLETARRKSGRLEALSQTLRKYNQALEYVHSGSEDLAVLQLIRVVEDNPKYVKAQLLLATLLILGKDYSKAQKHLRQILRYDRQNPVAISYLNQMRPIEPIGGKEMESGKDALGNVILSHRKMLDDDVILPSSYRENTGWQSVVNIIIGLILGAAAIYFLVMPANTRLVNQAHNQEMLDFYEKLNDKNIEAARLGGEASRLQELYDEISLTLQDLEERQGYMQKQYQTLASILDAYTKDDMRSAVLLYTDWDPSVIPDETSKTIADRIHGDMLSTGYQVLADMAASARQQGNLERAAQYYEDSLAIKPDNPQAIFDLAKVTKQQGQEEEANRLFGRVIMEFPNTDLARQAKEERGY
ncbi:MAG: tetratricopeptide repeat protein [Lachnospiraceae bacterium]|jgi:tetratricopeptide (TPR) repeat protein|nr:tetratricopeptide repeat protein [Lachnospiraceae bacterium]